MTHKLLALAQLITRSNTFFVSLEGVLFGALLFFSLLAFLRNRARKHGEIL